MVFERRLNQKIQGFFYLKPRMNGMKLSENFVKQ